MSHLRWVRRRRLSKHELVQALAFWVERSLRMEAALPDTKRYMTARGCGHRYFLLGLRVAEVASPARLSTSRKESS